AFRPARGRRRHPALGGAARCGGNRSRRPARGEPRAARRLHRIRARSRRHAPVMPQRTLISWSGGKDSAWTLHVLRRDPEVEIAGVFTTVHDELGRVAVHAVPTSLLPAHGEAAAGGLPSFADPDTC